VEIPLDQLRPTRCGPAAQPAAAFFDAAGSPALQVLHLRIRERRPAHAGSGPDRCASAWWRIRAFYLGGPCVDREPGCPLAKAGGARAADLCLKPQSPMAWVELRRWLREERSSDLHLANPAAQQRPAPACRSMNIELETLRRPAKTCT